MPQDVLDNEDVKLDNMFTASMVADIIRVRPFACIDSKLFILIVAFCFYLKGNDVSSRVSPAIPRIVVHLELSDRQPLGGETERFRTAGVQARPGRCARRPDDGRQVPKYCFNYY